MTIEEFKEKWEINIDPPISDNGSFRSWRSDRLRKFDAKTEIESLVTFCKWYNIGCNDLNKLREYKNYKPVVLKKNKKRRK